MALAGATLRTVVYDFLHTFKQVYDDADITPYQMSYWVIIHADRMRKQHIEKRDSGEYIAIFDVAVSTDSDNLKYITLPQRIYDMDMDKAINFISYAKLYGENKPTYVQRTFSRTTAAGAKRLYYREQEAPSADNPYFFRVGDVVKLLGVEDLAIDQVAVGLITSLNPTASDLDLDQPFDFPQDLLPILERQILDLGMLALQMPRDLNNDGTGVKEGPVPAGKLTSVQDFSPYADQILELRKMGR